FFGVVSFAAGFFSMNSSGFGDVRPVSQGSGSPFAACARDVSHVWPSSIFSFDQIVTRRIQIAGYGWSRMRYVPALSRVSGLLLYVGERAILSIVSSDFSLSMTAANGVYSPFIFDRPSRFATTTNRMPDSPESI